MVKVKIKNNSDEQSPAMVSSEIKFINPSSVVETLEITPGMNIADFGCATGYFTFPLAKKVGSGGTIYAFDILAEKLETVESQAKILGLSNIITKKVNLEKLNGSELSDGSVDWVFLVNVLFQNKDKNIIIREAKRVLKANGKILIIEWNDSNTIIGPKKEVRISKEEILKLAGKNKLAEKEELSVSDFHYGFVLEK